jgi:hypothetical protein
MVSPLSEALAAAAKCARAEFDWALADGSVAEFNLAAAWVDTISEAALLVRRFTTGVVRREKEIMKETGS